jgi:hypothetical protein
MTEYDKKVWCKKRETFTLHLFSGSGLKKTCLECGKNTEEEAKDDNETISSNRK